MILAPLADLAVPLESLQPLAGNPRKGDVDAMVASLSRFGQRKPIVVRASDRQIVAGNHTWMAARKLGWTEIAAVIVDDDDATAKAYALADNRLGELGGYDEAALLDMIRAVGDEDAGLLADAGWDPESVAELVARIDPLPPEEPPADDAPEPPAAPFSKLGDVWILGRHRLLCGDATSTDDLAKVLGGDRADLVVTDPPYGVSYQGAAGTLMNDDLAQAQLQELLEEAFRGILVSLRPGGAFYVFGPSGDLETVFRLAMRESGLRLRQQIVWVKDRFVLGRQDYHLKHETCLYGWAEGETPGPVVPPLEVDEAEEFALYGVAHDTVLYGWNVGRGHTWLGGRRQDSVWVHPRPQSSKLHPTMKPVALVERAVLNSTRPGDVVLDVFGGSGSTLMACEHAGRAARLVELDPKFVDVIARRWQEYTGLLPVLEATGEPHDFTE